MGNTMKVAFVFMLCIGAIVASAPYKQIGEFKVKDPSFLQLFPQDHGDVDALWITTFSGNPFTPGQVLFAKNIANQVASNPNKIELAKVNGTFQWPNLISYVPNGTIAGGDDVVAIVPDGFLVPGKGTGGLYVLTKDGKGGYNKGISLVEQEQGWFYHMVYWRDVNQDGRMDIITARAKNDFATFRGELVWLEQPESGALDAPWEKHFLAHGPDVLFAVADFDPKDSVFQIYAAQFFSSSLKLYDIQEGKTPKVTYAEEIYPLPSPYDIKIVDLDRDGNSEILCTEHLDGAGGNVTSFTIPKVNYHNKDEYTQTQLMSGYTVTEPGNNQMAPGFITLMHPYAKDKSEPPNMFIAGDGSQKAYYMTHQGKLSYDQEVIIDVNGVVGIVAAGNIGPNGANQFFVPNYDGNQIFIYSF